jgi:hypothetical protein
MEQKVQTGSQSMISNHNRFLNSAFGLETLHNNTVGARNTAIGSKALYYNNIYDNTAVRLFDITE